MLIDDKHSFLAVYTEEDIYASYISLEIYPRYILMQKIEK